MEEDALRRFRTQMRMLGRRLRRELPTVRGVSRSAVQVLRVVAVADKPSPGDVADKLRMTSSNVAAALRELEAAGLVSRGRDPEDGRRVRLRLTDVGAGAVSCVHAERDTWLGRAVETVLSADEQRTLLAAGELMQRLAEFQDAQLAGERDAAQPAANAVAAAATHLIETARRQELR